MKKIFIFLSVLLIMFGIPVSAETPSTYGVPEGFDMTSIPFPSKYYTSETHPYAIMVSGRNSDGIITEVYFYKSSMPFYTEDGILLKTDKSTSSVGYTRYSLKLDALGAPMWIYSNESTNGLSMVNTQTLLWTSHDISYDGDLVYVNKEYDASNFPMPPVPPNPTLMELVGQTLVMVTLPTILGWIQSLAGLAIFIMALLMGPTILLKVFRIFQV